ncbi:MAG TPA: hypothetical protein VLE44_01405, partial [Candidatus Saccharimonadales bacterium]|nr:hypothetical protein [Candidatus Saccharimonadales bacterium]
SPIFLADTQTMAELDWYIFHGLPELINVLNVPALKTVGEEVIERLRQQARTQNKIFGNDTKKSTHIGFGVNGTNKVK